MLYEGRISLDDEVNVRLQLQLLLLHDDFQLLILLLQRRVNGASLLHLVNLKLHLLERRTGPVAVTNPLLQILQAVPLLRQRIHHEVRRFHILRIEIQYKEIRASP